jgi:formylmethanofuran dehydrogenase subunit E
MTMGGTTPTQEQIQRAVDFHGHWCPGLAIGIRAGELALQEFGPAGDEEVVAAVETDMCGVDAIQVLTGCTFGKGNLLHRDHGKMAFTFYRRRDGKALRFYFTGEGLGAPSEEMTTLNRKRSMDTLGPEEARRLEALRAEWSERIMGANPSDLFRVQPVAGPAPQRARLMASLGCEACGEKTMESRTRRFDGRILCVPCFERLDRRH